MGPFSRRDTAMTEAVTGTDVLRATVKARSKSPHALALIAREIDGVGAGMLEDFAAGKVDLNIDALKALTKILYQNTEFDPDQNLLRSIAPPATLIGITPPPFDPARGSPYHPPFNLRATSGIKSTSPTPPARPLKRPGWA